MADINVDEIGPVAYLVLKQANGAELWAKIRLLV